MLLPAGNASSNFGITNAAPTSRVPLSSSTTMISWDAAKALQRPLRTKSVPNEGFRGDRPLTRRLTSRGATLRASFARLGSEFARLDPTRGEGKRDPPREEAGP